MRRHVMLLIIVSIFWITALSVVSPATAQTPVRSGMVDTGTDSNPVGPPVVVIPSKYQVQSADRTAATAVAGTPVYFTPQDENTSATVLFVYNTNKVDKIIGLQTFDLAGAIYIDTTMTVPAFHLIRICTDTVSTISATWADYILANFTTFSTYAKLTLPNGVKADGYVVYNPSGTYDPLTEAQMLPLRFSAKNPTVP